jgi:hypothetical protein
VTIIVILYNYEIWYERQDGSVRAEALDGMSGMLNERIASMLT